MSSYRARCGEIRRRVLDGETQAELTREDNMPSNATLGKHLRGECICESTIPPVESVGYGPNLSYRVTQPVECPDCGDNGSVEALDKFTQKWVCHDCERRFELSEALDAVDDREIVEETEGSV